MKITSTLIIGSLCLILTGCGGHGYEGEYKMENQSDGGIAGDLANSTGSNGTRSLTIGSDYMESRGRRTSFDDIFVRESGSTRYLVFQKGESEQTLRIVNDETLKKKTGLGTVTWTKVGS